MKSQPIKSKVGQRFDRLVVLSLHGRFAKHGSWKETYWLCQCDCGKKKVIAGSNLKRSSKTKSCGCLHVENNVRLSTKHGYANRGATTPEYYIWVKMIRRCHNKKDPAYKYYGARGISVCGEWRKSFSNFIKDMGRRPAHLKSIERRNNNGNYEPDNCKWATPKEQGNNSRRNIILKYKGESKTISQWADYCKINYATFYDRLERGWSVPKAIETPVRHIRWLVRARK